MSVEAFEGMRYGPIGDAVAEAEPHTEADPVGIYAAMLALWSTAINGHVTLYNGSNRRPVVVWTVLVGESAIGCKGTALRVAHGILKPAIGSFLEARTAGGVSSGPSLTQLLYEKQEETMGTEGGTDTRLVVVDDEWRENLSRQNRCPTFASKLRSCWDGVTIRHTTTKVSMTVEQPRLGFHAHITPGEWSEYVKPRDAKGGSFNRLLPVMVEGSKVLPYNHKEYIPEVPELSEAYNWARIAPRTMSLSKDAGKRFDELRVMFLAKLAEMPRHLTCYIERTPEQIVRVAAVLTATERRTTISREAVNAAWAFVQYSMRSVEKLVREDAAVKSSGKTFKPLPEIIREIMARYEGEVPHSTMLRCLGTRATAASLRAALKGMGDIDVVPGVTSGRGRPGTVYRWAEKQAQTEESEPEPAQPEPVVVPPVVLTLDTSESTREPELALSGGWL